MGQCLEKDTTSPHKEDTSNSFDYRQLIRTTKFSVLNAEDHEGSDDAGEVWAANIDTEQISRHWVSHSSPSDSIDYFISHAWDDEGYSKGLSLTPTWESADQLNEFGWRKAVAFQNVVRTIVEMKGIGDRTALRFWLDKACIPQYDGQLKVQCISSFEGFIKSSYGLIVLLSPRYPKRLWCVYEVACFLCTKAMDRVFINHRSFGCDKNIQIYIDAVRNFSIDTCECKVEFDKTILEAKVSQYYTSKEDFACFVQAALTTLIVRDYYSYPPMIKTVALFDEYVGPWLAFMEETTFLKDLHRAFVDFDVPRVYEESDFDDPTYMTKLQLHLGENVYPMINAMRLEYCTQDGLSLYQG